MQLRVALDATYAGTNPTGVGLYSARLAAKLEERSAQLGLDLRCYGPACSFGKQNIITGTMQEWPVYTHGILPLRLLRQRPAIVHSTSHIGPIWGPGKLIVTVHDLIFMRYPEDYDPAWLALTRAILPRVLRRAKAIIADSHTTKEDIHAFLGIRKGKIAVIYPGIDDEYRRVGARYIVPEQSQSTLTQTKPYILCLGPWVRRKNIGVVVQAFARLAPRLPHLRLIITGNPSRGMKGYSPDDLLRGLPAEIRSKVNLMGYVPQDALPALIQGASTLAYPSRFEGFGLPPLEAMAAGVPVVAANTPAVVEVTGGAALIAEPDNPEQWAGAIERILLDQAEAQRLREAGLRRSAAFTWDRCAEQTARLYHMV